MFGVRTTTAISNSETFLTEKEMSTVQEQSSDLIHNIREIKQSSEKMPSLTVSFNMGQLPEVEQMFSPSTIQLASSGDKFNDKQGVFINKLKNDNGMILNDFHRYVDHAKKILLSGPLIIGEAHSSPLAKAIVEQLVVDGVVKNLLLEQCDFTLLSQQDLNYLKRFGNKNALLFEKLRLRVKECGAGTIGEYYGHLQKYISSNADVAKAQQEEIVALEQMKSGRNKINSFYTLMKFASAHDVNIHFIDYPEFLVSVCRIRSSRSPVGEISKYVDARNRYMAQVSRDIIKNDPDSGIVILVGANHLYNDISAGLTSIEDYMGIANSQTFDVSTNSTLAKELNLDDSSRVWMKKPYIPQRKD